MLMNIQDLSGDVAIVTGASSGTGLATENMLAREGVKVALVSSTFVPIKET
jgi:NADP-dependent 3-hydroxy acid dehydrogenase YdfG